MIERCQTKFSRTMCRYCLSICKISPEWFYFHNFADLADKVAVKRLVTFNQLLRKKTFTLPIMVLSCTWV